MFLIVLAAMIFAQSEAPAAEDDAVAIDAVDVLAAPPKLNRAKAILCSCAKTKAPEFMLQGLVVDAELTLAPNGRKAAARQATIFDVLSATENGEPADIDGRLKIFHQTDTAQCGVRFDYGKEYMVYAQKNEDDAYETDYCLMNAAFDVSPPEAAGEQPAPETDPKGATGPKSE